MSYRHNFLVLIFKKEIKNTHNWKFESHYKSYLKVGCNFTTVRQKSMFILLARFKI